MSGVLVSVRLDAEAVAGIDERVGSRGRSGFIRDAVSAALRPSVAPVEEKVASAKPPAFPPSVLPCAVTEAERKKAVEVRREIRDIEAQRVAANERADKMTALLEAIRLRAMTAREAATELGWPELLVAKVADKLTAAGMIHFPRGAGVMVAI